MCDSVSANGRALPPSCSPAQLQTVASAGATASPAGPATVKAAKWASDVSTVLTGFSAIAVFYQGLNPPQSAFPHRHLGKFNVSVEKTRRRIASDIRPNYCIGLSN